MTRRALLLAGMLAAATAEAADEVSIPVVVAMGAYRHDGSVDGLLRVAHDDQLAESELRVLLPVLVEAYHTSGANGLLHGIRAARRRGSQAAYDVLPLFIPVVGHNRRRPEMGAEPRNWDVLDLLLDFDKVPPEVLDAIVERRRAQGGDLTPQQCAVLLKFRNDQDAKAWLIMDLRSPRQQSRLEAAHALGRAAPASRPSLPQLIETLQDKSNSIRVAAAVAILRCDADAEPANQALDVLLRELTRASYVYSVRPTRASESVTATQRNVAAAALGDVTFRKPEVAQALLGVVRASENDPLLPLAALASLGRLNVRNPAVLAAVREQLDSENRSRAAETLNLLTD